MLRNEPLSLAYAMLLHHCMFLQYVTYVTCSSLRSTCIYMRQPLLYILLHACGNQCLQHVVSYKVTKLAVPFKMVTIADLRESIPSLPDVPHHPKRFDFPKRSFGKTKLFFVQQRASGSILGQTKRQDVMFCNACVTAFELGRIKSICKCIV